MTRTDTARRKPVPLPPEPARVPVRVQVSCYVTIAVTATLSILVGIYGDHNRGMIAPLALAAGFLPPFLSAMLAEIGAAFESKWIFKAVVYGFTLAAMSVSAFNIGVTLSPGLPEGVAVTLAVAMDGTSIACLYVIFESVSRSAAWRRWRALKDAAAAEAALVPGNHDDGSREPGKDDLGTGGAGTGNRGASVPGTGAGTTGTGAGHPGSGQQDTPVPPPPAQSPPPPPEVDRVAAAKALHDRRVNFTVTWAATYAAQPKRPFESAEHQQADARRFVADFHREFGMEPNTGELGKALGIRKADAGPLKNSLGQSRRTA